MPDQRSPLLTAPIVPTLARLAAPGIVLALFQTAVSIGDTYFVGRLGTEALAGLALVFPDAHAAADDLGRRDGRRRVLGGRARARRGQPGRRAQAGRARPDHRAGRRPRVHRAAARFRARTLRPARRPRRGARAGARLLADHLRRRGAGLDLEHAGEPAARQRQHARAGARVRRHGAGAGPAFRRAHPGLGTLPAAGHRRRGNVLRHRVRAREPGDGDTGLAQPAAAAARPPDGWKEGCSARSCASARSRRSRRCRPCSRRSS